MGSVTRSPCESGHVALRLQRGHEDLLLAASPVAPAGGRPREPQRRGLSLELNGRLVTLKPRSEAQEWPRALKLAEAVA